MRMVDIGKILQAAGVISTDQLRAALAYQSANPTVLLGAAVMLLNFATAQQIEDALKQHYMGHMPAHGRLNVDDVTQLVSHMAERSEEIAASTDLLAQRLYNLSQARKL